MTSWISKSHVKKRIFLEQPVYINKEKEQPLHEIQLNTQKKGITVFEPYLFNTINGYNIINTIRKFSNTSLTHVKKIVNVYKPYFKNKKANGFGDFLRGCYFLIQYCNIAKIDFDINMRYHAIHDVLCTEFDEIDTQYLDNIVQSNINNYDHGPHKKMKDTTYINIINQINTYLLSCKCDKEGTIYVSIIPYPIFIIQDNERSLMRAKLSYNPILQTEIDKIFNKYTLKEKEYNIIHIRSGDKYLLNYSDIISNANFVNNIINEIDNNITQLPTILLSDNSYLKQYIKIKYENMIILDNIPSHTGEGDYSDIKQIISNLLDFYLMSKAANIVSLTVYEHGTGFSKWCAETYSIPYKVTMITE